MNSHIVVVEDDVDQLANYSYALTKKGFKVPVMSLRRDSGRAFWETESSPFDIHLGRDPDAGFGICQWLLTVIPDYQ